MFTRARVPIACRALLALLALWPVREARADDTHYQDYPLGGRSVGLGGAFVALGDDPSGIIFNPAGIVDATRTSVQVSTTLYGLEVADSFFSAVGKVSDLKTVFTELNVIPSSASFITSIGELGPDGRPEQSYGFGAFVPSYRSINAHSVATPTIPIPGCPQLAYQRHLLDRTLYFGGAYGQRLDELWRVGISGFLSYRALRDQEQTACFGEVSADGNASFNTAQTDLDAGVASLLIALGFKVELGGGWFLGGTVTTPSIHVFDTGSVRVTHASARNGRSTFLLDELNGIDADTRVGTSVRAGIAYVIPRVLTFVADATFQAPAHYTLFSIRPDLRDDVTLVSDVQRDPVVNLNAGLEYLISKPVSISGGLFTNFTSAPQIPEGTGDIVEGRHLPHVNAYGGSLVLGLFSEHTLTRAGLTLSYGDGTDVAARVEGAGAVVGKPEFVKASFSQLFIFFFVSSTFRY